MRRVLTLAAKDLRLLFRDRATLFFTVAFPVIFGIFFGAIFSRRSDDSAAIPVALVDLDQSERSKALVKALAGAKELQVSTQTGDPPAPLSPQSAADLVRLGRRTAFIIIPKGYGSDDRGMFFGRGSELSLGVDPSRQAEAGMLEGVLMRYAFEQFTSTMQDPASTRREIERARKVLRTQGDAMDPGRRLLMEGMFAGVDNLMADMERQRASREAAAPDKKDAAEKSADAPADATDAPAEAADPGFAPVRIVRSDVTRQRTGPQNSYAVSFPQAIMWGIAACAAAFGVSLVTERARGTLLRLRTAPMSWAQILAGKTLACFAATMTVGVGLLVLARVAFGVVPGSMPLLALALLCVSLCFVGLMMLLAVLGRSESSAGSIGWAAIIVLMMVGGGTVPIFFMPGWLQALSYLSPVRWGLLALEGALWRGMSPAEMLTPCAILAGVGVGGLLLGVRLFRWSES